MKKWNNILFVLTALALVTLVPNARAQAGIDSLSFRDTLFTISTEARSLFIDKLGQLYVLTKSNSVEKYSADGKLLFRFNDNDFGPIHSIDVTNPLQIALWIKTYQKIVVLDRTLNPLSSFLLEDSGVPLVETVCVANQNQLWLYDVSTFRFKLLSSQGKILREGQDLSLLMEEQFRPRLLWEQDNRLFVLDQSGSVSEFDTYGAFIRRVANIGEDMLRAHPQPQGVLYRKKNGCWNYASFQLGRPEVEFRQLQNSENVAIFGKRAYVSDGTSVKAVE